MMTKVELSEMLCFAIYVRQWTVFQCGCDIAEV